MFLNGLNISNFTTDSNDFTWLAEKHWTTEDCIYFIDNLSSFDPRILSFPFKRHYTPSPKRKIKKTTNTINLFGSWILKDKKSHAPLMILILDGRSKIFKICNLHFLSTTTEELALDLLCRIVSTVITSLFICCSFDSINILNSPTDLSKLDEFKPYTTESFYSWPELKEQKRIVILPSTWEQDHDPLYKKLDYLNSRKIEL